MGHASRTTRAHSEQLSCASRRRRHANRATAADVREADEPIRRTVENMTRVDRVRKSPAATWVPIPALISRRFQSGKRLQAGTVGGRGCIARLEGTSASQRARPDRLGTCRIADWESPGRAIRPGSNELDGEGIMKPAASRVARWPKQSSGVTSWAARAVPITRPTLVEYRVEQRTAKLEHRSARL
jgi:hypothetical protein